jgi:glucokinase
MGKGKKKIYVGFDLGGTKMMAVVYDEKMKPLGRARKKTHAQEGTKAGLQRIRDTIDQALDDANVGRQRLAGIGIAIPGPLDLNRGVILELPNLGWKNAHVKRFLEQTFHCCVVPANDVDAGVYGEYRFGAGKGARCVVGIFPGTGIGGGCVYEGRLLRGKTGSCLEIGHVQVQPGGPLCGCGRRGCLESVASRLAIASAAAESAYRGGAPNLLHAGGTDLESIRSSDIADAIKAGDAVVEEIVRDAARWIGVGISVVVQILSPDVVILGGGLVEAMPGIFLKESWRTARARVMPAFARTFRVKTAKLGDDAGVMGAAALAMDAADSAGRGGKHG